MSGRPLVAEYSRWAVAAATVLALLVPPPSARAQGEAVLVSLPAVTSENVAGWRKQGFTALAIVLDESAAAPALERASKAAAAQSLDLYYWIEVGRNFTLARQHPEWMASLGMHDDWRRRFPNVRPLGKDEVAKAWPWVPIRYREASEAQRTRIAQLLSRVPAGYRGVLLNDLQGGPASCGCGNLQCRWATDYHVPSLGTKVDPVRAAADFVADIARSLPGKEVIPVWTTECAREDLPASKLPSGSWSTGYCGNVPCFDYCRQRFAEQWQALQANRTGSTALLLLHREFQRERKEYGEPTRWVATGLTQFEKSLDRPISRDRLWLVVQGYGISAEEAADVRQTAARLKAGRVLIARTRIDQTFEPRIVKTNPAK
jgi:hypothetical protein